MLKFEERKWEHPFTVIFNLLRCLVCQLQKLLFLVACRCPRSCQLWKFICHLIEVDHLSEADSCRGIYHLLLLFFSLSLVLILSLEFRMASLSNMLLMKDLGLAYSYHFFLVHFGRMMHWDCDSICNINFFVEFRFSPGLSSALDLSLFKIIVVFKMWTELF